jgi:endonuclease/exonuclease/phosphatase family metal-dependent hydrolase
LRIASYNVLADCYVRAEYYPGASPEILRPGARTDAVIKRIEGLAADVVCLQEVEPNVAMALGIWNLALKPGKPEGLAIKTALRVCNSRSIRCATLAELEIENPAGEIRVGVASCHLAWAPEGTRSADHPGFAQAGAVLENLWGCDAWFVCGDFNAPAGSDVVQRFLDAGFRDVGPQTPTCVANGSAKRIDFILARGDVDVIASPIRPLHDHSVLPSDTEPSDHLPIVATIGLEHL